MAPATMNQRVLLSLILQLSLKSNLFALSDEAASETRPNIIFMFGDDIGFNDLGYLGCTDTQTPRIDDLALNEGLVLWYNYASKICSPSRSAFLSGRYPSTLGLQNLVFNTQYPVSLTRQVSVLSEEFKANGYSTHMIGKWHLGYASWEYTPTYRGFDSFHGFYGGLSSYYNHSQCMGMVWTPNTDLCLYDLRINEEEDWNGVRDQQFGTLLQRDQTLQLLAEQKEESDPFFLYLAWQSSHSPDEAPDEYISYYHDDDDDGGVIGPRVMAQAQTTVLDDSIGAVVDYLKENGMWEDTLIVFSSDNGGQYWRNDNSPLRGFKNTSFEGGVRVPAFVTGGYLNENRKGVIAKDFMVSVVDWYPTLLSAAGIELGHHKSLNQFGTDTLDSRFDDNGVDDVPLDGRDLWNAIQFGDDYITDEISSESRELLLDLNGGGICSFSSCGAIRSGHWKFIRGENMGVNSSTSKHQWSSGHSTCDSKKMNHLVGCSEIRGPITDDVTSCHLTENGCLFNLRSDACERINVGDDYPKIREHLKSRLDAYQDIAAPILIHEGLKVDPTYDEGTAFWGPFMEYKNVTFEQTLESAYKVRYPLSSQSMLWRVSGGKLERYRMSDITWIIAGAMCIVVVLSMIGVKCFGVRKMSLSSELAPLLNEL